MHNHIRCLNIIFLILSIIFVSGCGNDGGKKDNDPPGNNIGAVVTIPVKQYFGADLSAFDDDGDGLNNEFEILYGFPYIQPDLLDTDGNGINDGEEDLDGDGLSNLVEQQNKTNPNSKDSDNDFLDDDLEINVYGTNPVVADTDGDGILDGREVLNSSDPLVADADRVVVSSSVIKSINYETGLEEEITIAVTGEGDLSKSITVANWADVKLDGQIGRSFDISLPDDLKDKMQSADITLPYNINDPQATNPDNLAIFTINPETNFWEELPSIADASSGTVTATTNHFSPFLIAEKEAFTASADKVPATCSAIDSPEAMKTDVMLVIDSSGSMATNDPDNLRVSSAQAFVARMKDSDRVGVVDFNDVARLLIGLSNDKDAIIAALGHVRSLFGTDIGAGVHRALSALASSVDDSAIKAIILFTDGEGDYPESLTTEMASAGIRAFTVGLSGDVDEALLQSIADGTSGIYRKIDTAAEITPIFAELETVFGDDGTDTDGDGLTDCQEIQGFYVPKLGRLIQTLPDERDSDGDGLLDGEEVGTLLLGDGSSVTKKAIWVANNSSSNPRAIDTDGDLISDPDEEIFSTNPFLEDSDTDGVSDYDEINIYGTDPLYKDSDGDGAPDGFEILRIDEGFDPNVYNYSVDIFTKLKFITELSEGAVLGDIIDIDTPPELYGQILGGFVPVADARDFLANLFKEEYVDAGLSAIGVFPLIGDTAAAGEKVRKFVEKFPRYRYEVINLLNKHFDDVDWVKKYLPPIPKRSESWDMPPLQRGKDLEKPIGELIRKDGDIGLFGNFPKIDMWNEETGKAVSIKTLDLDAKTYQNASAFRRTIDKYADELNKFEKATGNSVELDDVVEIISGQVKLRELVIGVPRELDSDFSEIILELKEKYDFSIVTVVI